MPLTKITTDNIDFSSNLVFSNVASMNVTTLNAGDALITGNLTVTGTTVTVNTNTIDVKDLNITVAKGAGSSALSNGAGLTVDFPNAQMFYASSDDSWNLNKRVNVANGLISTGSIGIGTDPNGVAGIGNPVVGNNNLIVYNAGNTGITVLTDNAAVRTAQIGFGAQGLSLFDAGLKYDTSTRGLQFVTGAAGSLRMQIASGGDVTVGSTVAANTLRYFDVRNIDTGVNAGSIIRLITQSVANTGGIAVDLVKYKNGGFYINNNETNAAAFTSFGVGGTDHVRITANGNVGVGTTTPSAPLTIKSDSTNIGVRVLNSSNGKGTLQFTDDPVTTGQAAIEAGSNNYMAFQTNAIERIRIDGSGNIGIGTTSPRAPLAFAATAGTAGDANRIRLYDDGANNVYGFGISNGQLNIRSGQYSSIAFFTSSNTADSSERMRIDGAGVVGIGTNSPSTFAAAGLAVSGQTTVINNSAGWIYKKVRSDNTQAMGIHDDSGFGRLALYSQNQQVMNFYPSNNEAFITLNAGATSHYFAYNEQGGEFQLIDNSGNGSIFIDSINGIGRIYKMGSGVLEVGSSGNVLKLVGQGSAHVWVSSSSISAGLGGAGSAAVHAFRNGTGDYSNCGVQIQDNTGNPCLGFHAGGTSAYMVRHERGYGGIDSVNGNQSAFAAFRASAFNVASDYRIKENVEPLVNATDRLMLLKPSRFNYKKDSMMGSQEKVVDGFLAHEVSPAVPEAVMGEKDAVDKNGNIQMQSLDLTKLVPLLTASLQEAILEIRDLKDKVAQLEARNGV